MSDIDTQGWTVLGSNLLKERSLPVGSRFPPYSGVRETLQNITGSTYDSTADLASAFAPTLSEKLIELVESKQPSLLAELRRALLATPVQDTDRHLPTADIARNYAKAQGDLSLPITQSRLHESIADAIVSQGCNFRIEDAEDSSGSQTVKPIERESVVKTVARWMGAGKATPTVPTVDYAIRLCYALNCTTAETQRFAFEALGYSLFNLRDAYQAVFYACLENRKAGQIAVAYEEALHAIVELRAEARAASGPDTGQASAPAHAPDLPYTGFLEKDAEASTFAQYIASAKEHAWMYSERARSQTYERQWLLNRTNAYDLLLQKLSLIDPAYVVSDTARLITRIRRDARAAIDALSADEKSAVINAALKPADKQIRKMKSTLATGGGTPDNIDRAIDERDALARALASACAPAKPKDAGAHASGQAEDPEERALADLFATHAERYPENCGLAAFTHRYHTCLYQAFRLATELRARALASAREQDGHPSKTEAEIAFLREKLRLYAKSDSKGNDKLGNAGFLAFFEQDATLTLGGTPFPASLGAAKAVGERDKTIAPNPSAGATYFSAHDARTPDKSRSLLIFFHTVCFIMSRIQPTSHDTAHLATSPVHTSAGPRKIYVQAIHSISEKPLFGAVLQLYEHNTGKPSDATLVQQWSTTARPCAIDLKDGTYTICSLRAPQGYRSPITTQTRDGRARPIDAITFSIDGSGVAIAPSCPAAHLPGTVTDNATIRMPYADCDSKPIALTLAQGKKSIAINDRADESAVNEFIEEYVDQRNQLCQEVGVAPLYPRNPSDLFNWARVGDLAYSVANGTIQYFEDVLDFLQKSWESFNDDHPDAGFFGRRFDA